MRKTTRAAATDIVLSRFLEDSFFYSETVRHNRAEETEDAVVITQRDERNIVQNQLEKRSEEAMIEGELTKD